MWPPLLPDHGPSCSGAYPPRGGTWSPEHLHGGGGCLAARVPEAQEGDTPTPPIANKRAAVTSLTRAAPRERQLWTAPPKHAHTTFLMKRGRPAKHRLEVSTYVRFQARQKKTQLGVPLGGPIRLAGPDLEASGELEGAVTGGSRGAPGGPAAALVFSTWVPWVPALPELHLSPARIVITFCVCSSQFTTLKNSSWGEGGVAAWREELWFPGHLLCPCGG